MQLTFVESIARHTNLFQNMLDFGKCIHQKMHVIESFFLGPGISGIPNLIPKADLNKTIPNDYLR